MGLVELGEAPLMCLVLLPLHRHLGMVVDDLEGVGYKTCKSFAFSVLFFTREMLLCMGIT